MELIKFILFKFLRFIYLLPSKIAYLIYNKKNFIYPCSKSQKFLIDKNKELDSTLKEIEKFYLSENINKIDEFISFGQNKGKYYTAIEDLLSEELNNKLKNVLTNKTFLDYLGFFFGYKLKFNKLTIRLNFYNRNLPEEEGPKMWHRDNDSFFGQIKLFSVINQLNAESGGLFSFIPQIIIKDYQYVKNLVTNNKLSISDQKSRILNSEMKKIKNVEENIIKFGTNKYDFLAVDTNDTYHKGGFLSEKNSIRLLLQVIYEPSFNSLSNYNPLYKKNLFIFHTKNFFTAIKNRLRTKVKN